MQECKIVGAIDNLRTISDELKKFMQECEDEVISMENKIVEIGKKS